MHALLASLPLIGLPEQATQRLAWVLVHFVWQGAAVAGLLALTLWLGRVRRPSVRYACGLVALAVMVACPVITFVVVRPVPDAEVGESFGQTKVAITAPRDEPVVIEPPFVKGSSRGAMMAALKGTPSRGSLEFETEEFGSEILEPQPPSANTTNATVQRPDASVEQLTGEADRVRSKWSHVQPWIVSGWLLGVALLSTRLLLGWLGVWRLRRRVEPVPEWIAQRVQHLAQALRVTRPLVHLSQRVTEAVAVGFLKPMILLPVAWMTELQPDMIEAVLAHELAHIRRGDLWVNLIQRLVETLLFYHPAVWWLSRQLRIDRELCCDELVVRTLHNPLRYAETLEHIGRLSLADSPGRTRSPLQTRGTLTVSIGSPQLILLHRIRAILTPPPQDRSPSAWLAGLIPLALACLVGWSLISRNAAPASDEPLSINTPGATGSSEPPVRSSRDDENSGGPKLPPVAPTVEPPVPSNDIRPDNLVEAAGTYRGRVVTDDGSPLPPNLKLMRRVSSEQTRETPVDPNGEFLFRTDPKNGSVRFSMTAAGFAPFDSNWIKLTEPLTLKLSRGAMVKLRLVPPAGSGPVAGSAALIVPWWDEDEQGTFPVDANGSVTIARCPKTTVKIDVLVPGFEEVRVHRWVRGDISLDVPLQPAKPTRLRIVSAKDGSPVAGTKVRLFSRTRPGSFLTPFQYWGDGPVWGESNADGRVELTTLRAIDPVQSNDPGAAIYAFRIDAPNHAPCYIGDVRAGSDLGEIQVGDSLEVRGEVVRDAAKPERISLQVRQPTVAQGGGDRRGGWRNIEPTEVAGKVAFHLTGLQAGPFDMFIVYSDASEPPNSPRGTIKQLQFHGLLTGSSSNLVITRESVVPGDKQLTARRASLFPLDDHPPSNVPDHISKQLVGGWKMKIEADRDVAVIQETKPTLSPLLVWSSTAPVQHSMGHIEWRVFVLQDGTVFIPGGQNYEAGTHHKLAAAELLELKSLLEKHRDLFGKQVPKDLPQFAGWRHGHENLSYTKDGETKAFAKWYGLEQPPIIGEFDPTEAHQAIIDHLTRLMTDVACGGREAKAKYRDLANKALTAVLPKATSFNDDTWTNAVNHTDGTRTVRFGNTTEKTEVTLIHPAFGHVYVERIEQFDKRIVFIPLPAADTAVAEKHWDADDRAALLKRLRDRDAQFESRAIEVEERSIERVSPQGEIRQQAFNDFKFGQKSDSRLPEGTPVPEDYDQPHRKRMLLVVREPDVTFDSLGDLEPPKHEKFGGRTNKGLRWSTVGGEERTWEPGLGRPDSIRRHGNGKPSLDGVLRSYQRRIEWCSGYGIAKWMKSIDSVRVNGDRTIIEGKISVLGYDTSSFELELDEDLIARRTLITVPARNGGGFVRYTVETQGTVRLETAPPVAESGRFRYARNPEGQPEIVDDDYEIHFIASSARLTDIEYKTQTQIPPKAPGATGGSSEPPVPSPGENKNTGSPKPLPVAPSEEAPDPDRVRRTNAVERGVQFLKSRQREDDGTWFEDGSQVEEATALATVALLQAGVKVDEAVIQNALPTLRKIEPKMIYIVALQTMALCAASPKEDTELIRRNVAWIENAQVKEGAATGGWSYVGTPTRWADGSCSRFAVLGLDAAKRAKFEVRAETWQRVATYWLKTQQENGGWGYQAESRPTLSMSLAGVAALATAHRHLPKDDQAAAREAAMLKPHELIAKGITAFVANEVTTPPQMSRIYACQCLERAGHLSNTVRFGGVDWRTVVTEQLLKEQRNNGAWGQPNAAENELIATSFALMFLSGRPEDSGDGKAEGAKKPLDPDQREMRIKPRGGKGATFNVTSHTKHDVVPPLQQTLLDGGIEIEVVEGNGAQLRLQADRAIILVEANDQTNLFDARSPVTSLLKLELVGNVTLEHVRQPGATPIKLQAERLWVDLATHHVKGEKISLILEVGSPTIDRDEFDLPTGPPAKVPLPKERPPGATGGSPEPPVSSPAENKNTGSPNPLPVAPGAESEPEEGDLRSEARRGQETRAEQPSRAEQAELKPGQTGHGVVLTVRGRVMIDGPIPNVPPLKNKPSFRAIIPRNREEHLRNEQREAAAPVVEIPDDSLVISKEGGIANVAIYLKKTPGDWKPSAPPSDLVVIEAAEHRFSPHMSFIRAGQSLTVKNSMNEATNFRSQPMRGSQQNYLLKLQGESLIKSPYTQSESLPHRFVSDVHPWMQGYLIALDHPFAAITDADGRFEIRDLPSGVHHFTVWHERRGYLNKDLVVFVDDGEVTEVELKYTAEQLERRDEATVAAQRTGVSVLPEHSNLAVVKLVREFGEHFAKQHFAEAEVAAKQAKELDPMTPKVNRLRQIAVYARRLAKGDGVPQVRSPLTIELVERLIKRAERLAANDREAAAKLVGRWKLTISGRYVYEAEFKQADDGTLLLTSLPNGSVLTGRFALIGKRLELVEHGDTNVHDFIWQVKSDNRLTLIVDETEVGEKYLGATLERIAEAK